MQEIFEEYGAMIVAIISCIMIVGLLVFNFFNYSGVIFQAISVFSDSLCGEPIL